MQFEDKRDFKYELEELQQATIEERKKELLLNAEKLKEIASGL